MNGSNKLIFLTFEMHKIYDNKSRARKAAFFILQHSSKLKMQLNEVFILKIKKRDPGEKIINN